MTKVLWRYQVEATGRNLRSVRKETAEDMCSMGLYAVIGLLHNARDHKPMACVEDYEFYRDCVSDEPRDLDRFGYTV